MKVTTPVDFDRAPPADAYLLSDDYGTKFVVLNAEEVRAFFWHCSGTPSVELFNRVDPNTVSLSIGMFTMYNNAAAILQAQGYVWDREAQLWREPPSHVPVTIEVHRHKGDPDHV